MLDRFGTISAIFGQRQSFYANIAKDVPIQTGTCVAVSFATEKLVFISPYLDKY